MASHQFVQAIAGDAQEVRVGMSAVVQLEFDHGRATMAFTTPSANSALHCLLSVRSVMKLTEHGILVIEGSAEARRSGKVRTSACDSPPAGANDPGLRYK